MKKINKILLSIMTIFLLGGSFSLADNTHSYSFDVECSDIYEPVCGDTWNQDKSTENKTFKNKCELEKFGAILRYEEKCENLPCKIGGVCEEIWNDESEAFSKWKKKYKEIYVYTNDVGSGYRLNSECRQTAKNINNNHNGQVAVCLDCSSGICEYKLYSNTKYLYLAIGLELKKTEKGNINTMIIKIPKVEYKITNSKYDFVTTWKEVNVPKSSAVLTATYKELLGDIFDSVSIKDKTAILKIKGDFNNNEYGYIFDIESPPIRAYEIIEAAFQFPTVDAIKVYSNEKIVDWCEYELADDIDSKCDVNNHYWLVKRTDWESGNKKLWEVTSKEQNNTEQIKYEIQFDIQKIMPIVTLILGTDNEELKNLLLAILIQIIKS